MIISKVKFLDVIIFILFAFLAVILATSKAYSNAVLDGLKLWVACVIPSLFPYLFITSILSTLKTTNRLSKILAPTFRFLFNLSGHVGYAFTLSVISGYPIGAKMIADLFSDGFILESEARRGAILCSSPSPMFLISSVGSLMFKSALFGVLIFVCNLLSNLLVAFVFSIKSRKTPVNVTAKAYQGQNSNPIYNGVFSAVNSILFVGGLITLFYVFSEILYSLKLLYPTTKLFGFIFGSEEFGKGISFALLETTKGLKVISCLGINFFTIPVVASLTGFGGLSVILQSVALLKNAKIKTAPFVLSKIVSAVINFIFGIVISLIFYGKYF